MAGQRFVDDDERFPMPSLAELVALHERICLLLARPARVLAVALNTRGLDEDAARARSRRRRRRQGCRRTTRCASAPAGSSTPSNRDPR